MHPPRLVVVVGAGCVEELVSPAGGIVVVVVIVGDTWTQNTDPTKLIVSGHHSGELTRVEDLAGADSEVAALLEVLGHGHHLHTCRHCRVDTLDQLYPHLGQAASELVVADVASRGVGTPPREEGAATGPA